MLRTKNSLKEQFGQSLATAHSGASKGSTCLKPEDMMYGKVFTLTFNPKEQPYDSRKYVATFKDWWDTIWSMFHAMASITVRLYVEVSRSGRWHFHGLLYLHNPIEFFSHDIHIIDEAGHYEIDTIDGYDGMTTWLIYCMKQQPMMEAYVIDKLLPMINSENYLMRTGFINIDTSFDIQ